MRRPTRKAKGSRARRNSQGAAEPWASVGALVTFRAEVMPGRSAHERTFKVERVDSSGRVELAGLAGQHTRTEFEPAR